MAGVPAKVIDRLSASIKNFQKIIGDAKSRDASESDTVIIVTDMLAEVFGYDKYTAITSEFAIKSKYCDLAIKDTESSKLRALIEVKAIGMELKDSHVAQAVDYAAHEGVDWAVLTNAMHWRVYRVLFEKPVDQELIVDIDFTTISPRKQEDLELLYLFCEEGWAKSALDDYEAERQALSRFFLGALLASDPIVKVVRRELKRLFPSVKLDVEQIQKAIEADVLKREVIEGEKAESARKKVAKSLKKHERETAVAEGEGTA